jgi:hypothetical protein
MDAQNHRLTLAALDLVKVLPKPKRSASSRWAIWKISGKIFR